VEDGKGWRKASFFYFLQTTKCAFEAQEKGRLVGVPAAQGVG